jgi:hypothetical protein
MRFELLLVAQLVLVVFEYEYIEAKISGIISSSYLELIIPKPSNTNGEEYRYLQKHQFVHVYLLI